MPYKAVFRWVITALRLGARALTPPLGLNFRLGAEVSGEYPVTIRWSPPASWGNDRDGAGTRAYSAAYRQILDANGARHTGLYSGWTPTRALAADDLDYTPPNAPADTVWEFRILAENRNGEHSGYAMLVYHAQTGSRRFGHRFQQRFD